MNKATLDSSCADERAVTLKKTVLRAKCRARKGISAVLGYIAWKGQKQGVA
jgi:hypothetical protein